MFLSLNCSYHGIICIAVGTIIIIVVIISGVIPITITIIIAVILMTGNPHLTFFPFPPLPPLSHPIPPSFSSPHSPPPLPYPPPTFPPLIPSPHCPLSSVSENHQMVSPASWPQSLISESKTRLKALQTADDARKAK